MVNATRDVRTAEQAIDQSISDQKRARQAYRTAVRAEQFAKQNKKTAQWKADAAYRKETALQSHAAKLARNSRAALERAKQLAWQLKKNYADNATAWNKTLTAEDLQYQTSEAVRGAADVVDTNKASLTDSVKQTQWYNVNAAKNASTLDAQAASEDAMVSRISAGYDAAVANATKYNFTIANNNLAAQGALRSDALSASYHASGAARRAAWEAQKFDKKSAAVNVAPAAMNAAPDADSYEEVETVQTTQTLG
jgi:hypothetical protein